MKQCCRNCDNFKNGICNVLNELLLIMTRVVNNKGETLMDAYPQNSLVIKDKHIDNFKCIRYKNNG